MAKSPRAALQRQAAIAAFARSHQVLVNVPQQAPIIERAPESRNSKFGCARLRPSIAVPAKTDLQSIIAALRMHTIVACAGFSLKLRIR
jgi:hypothetical protein